MFTESLTLLGHLFRHDGSLEYHATFISAGRYRQVRSPARAGRPRLHCSVDFGSRSFLIFYRWRECTTQETVAQAHRPLYVDMPAMPLPIAIARRVIVSLVIAVWGFQVFIPAVMFSISRCLLFPRPRCPTCDKSSIKIKTCTYTYHIVI